MIRLIVLLLMIGVCWARPRVVITADPELDDSNTLIRAMLYSSDFEIEGLVYASGTFHWRGDGKGTTQYLPGREYDRMGLGPQTSWRWADGFIDDVVAAYAKAYPNLKVHDKRYPAPAEMKAKIKWGNVEFEGDYSKDTEGSNLIKALLLDEKPGPLFVTAQGGASTIARALKSIYDEYGKTAKWAAVREKVSRKLVIVPFMDQDGTIARYIQPNWPGAAAWQLGGIDYGYFVRRGLAPENQVYVGAAWTAENVLSRGPLGALYRVWGDGKQMVKGDMTDYFGLSGLSGDELRKMGYKVWIQPQEKGGFLSEGDTPTFMNLLDNGLRAFENRKWSGWGGSSLSMRVPPLGVTGVSLQPAGPDDPGVGLGLRGSKVAEVKMPAVVNDAPVKNPAFDRFFAAAQNDFAARLKWSVTPAFGAANHEPKVRVKAAVAAKAGAEVRLVGEVSDPDGNGVKVLWWQDSAAGTYAGAVRFADERAVRTSFKVPGDAKAGETIHLILEATDDGKPALTRYGRVVVTVQ